ncbi:MAG: tRNA pseudouridine(55) synthase TruB, partial [Eubacterium sp.]|nr:tRNA pseudouridine(55) synthase TruB [Eubacterium sp.]
MYNGIVNVYKEPGFTSHDVVAKLRGIYGQKKVGHTGTLDPMAEGVLIVVLGQATKLSDLILTSRKQYIATMKLGVSTETDDTTGEKQKLCDGDKLRALVSDEKELRSKLESLFKEFLGKSMQVPPLYSAIKINGKKLYEYAREGIEIKPDARPVEIYSLEL